MKLFCLHLINTTFTSVPLISKTQSQKPPCARVCSTLHKKMWHFNYVIQFFLTAQVCTHCKWFSQFRSKKVLSYELFSDCSFIPDESQKTPFSKSTNNNIRAAGSTKQFLNLKFNDCPACACSSGRAHQGPPKDLAAADIKAGHAHLHLEDLLTNQKTSRGL